MDFLDLVRFPVTKPARYLGAEYFPTGYKPRTPQDLAVVLAYPDAYEVGMSNSGISMLYSILRRIPNIYVDAAFCPWPDMEAFLRQSGNPLPSRHGAIPLGQFDVVGFSLQYELTYTNMLTMLDLAGIPFYASQRSEQAPLVIAGGPCTTHPEPVAPFIDAFLIGDGEELLPKFLEVVRQGRQQNMPRNDLLRAVARIPGVYVPNVPGLESGEQAPYPWSGTERQVIDNLDLHGPFLDFPVPALETIFDRLSLELARGCQGGCRFCEAGYTYRPPRERSVPALMQWIDQALKGTGLEEVSLASLSTADYTGLPQLVQAVSALGESRHTSFTVSSLRAYGLQPEVMDFLARSRSSSLTLAPEAGSQRLRDVINKNVNENQILEAVHRAGHWGWNRLKLYFMLGLPTETTEDLEAIRSLAFNCMDVLRARFGRRAEISLAFSLFVPRPHTPFQWERMATLDELREKVDKVLRSMRRPGVEIKWHAPQMSVVEGLLARGDRKLAPVIEAVWRAGARFDSWEEHLRYDLWDQALTDAQLDRDAILGAIPLEATLPWDHIKVGVTKQYLLQERALAVEGRTTTPCTPFAASGRICHACGANCPTVRKPAGPQTPLQTTAPEAPAVPQPTEASQPTEVPQLTEVSQLTKVSQSTEVSQSTATTEQTAAPVQAHPQHDALSAVPPGQAGFKGPQPSAFSTKIMPPPQPARLMVAWQKLGDVCLLGHLDTQRHMLLTLRRVGLQLAHTRGFHPRPRLVFPPALPLGFMALDEWMDVALDVVPQTEGLLERLQAAGLPGIRFQRLGMVPTGTTPVDLAQPKEITYVLGFQNAEGLAQTEAMLEAANSPHFRFMERATPETWWPENHQPEALRVTWVFQNAPRIDRYVKEQLPHVEIPWVARERLHYGNDPL